MKEGVNTSNKSYHCVYSRKAKEDISTSFILRSRADAIFISQSFMRASVQEELKAACQISLSAGVGVLREPSAIWYIYLFRTA